MTPAARTEAAIGLLDAWAPGQGMDRLLLRWRRASRYAGSGDRAAIGDLVHDALRRWRSLAWPDEGAGGRARLLALAAERGEAEAIFSGAGYGPSPLTDAEHARLSSAPPPMPEAVAHDLPDWLWPRLQAAHGEAAGAIADALRRRAPVDLRVNTLKADPERAAGALAADGVETEPGPLSPLCLRVVSGGRRLRASKALADGQVEVQDAASQAVAALAEARPGERVLDFCAGGGGKALALAAAMEGRGEVLAHDAAPARMAGIKARAARAGAAVTVLKGAPPASLEGACDLVFVDAPCSGTGAWRRNPDAKWGFSPDDLNRLTALQRRILADAARFAAPGGRVLYATCSLLEEENGAVAAAAEGWSIERELRLTPLDGGDGFYGALLRRNSG